MKHLDLFSGIGGFALASTWVWGDEYENVGHCEIEEYACKVYHKHFPTSKCLGDITKVKWYEGQADIITGGFPCQPFSSSGKRAGKDDNRFLWPQMLRAIQEIKPKWVVAENVSGIFTIEKGLVFEQVCVDLEDVGYEVQPYCIPAASINAPHKRDRWWFVATNSRRSLQQGMEEQGNSNKEVITGDADFTKRSTNASRPLRSWDDGWVQVAAEFCGMDDGVPYRVDRLKGLGNAIVPQVAEIILQAIKEADEK